MQGINLARRPFVNRRPVLRLAVLLWIAGVGLAIHNVNQFTDHFQGTSEYRLRLIAIDRQIREERQKLTALDREMARVSLRRENRHASFLNRLIAYRTFPWSGLFDDLEEVVPRDVKLLSVKPNVQLKAESKKAKRPRRTRRSRSTSAQNADDAAPGESPESEEAGSSSDGEQSLRRDEVRLQLNGVAKTEDAVVELIEVLYASPSFRSPFLPGEIIEVDGTVRFTLRTIYLTGRGAVPEATSAQPGDGSELAATEGAAAAKVAEAAEIESEALEEGGPVAEEPSRPDATRGAAGGDATGLRSTGSRSTGSRSTGSRSTGSRPTGPRESTAPRRGQSAGPGSRNRPQALPGTRSGAGAALPGAGASGTSAAPGAAGTSDASGASSLPAPGEPTFAQPAASATPELRRGALIAPRTSLPLDVAPSFSQWEARA